MVEDIVERNLQLVGLVRRGVLTRNNRRRDRAVKQSLGGRVVGVRVAR